MRRNGKTIRRNSDDGWSNDEQIKKFKKQSKQKRKTGKRDIAIKLNETKK